MTYQWSVNASHQQITYRVNQQSISCCGVIQVHLAKPLSHSADEVAGMFTIAEKVQRRLIKMLPEFKDIKYEDALKKLKKPGWSHLPVQDV